MGNQKLLIEGQTIQQSKENRQYNSQKKTDNTTVKRKQTIQQSKENRQYNSQKKTDNTTVKRKQTKG